MKIGSVDVRISILPVAAVAFLAFGIAFAILAGPPALAAEIRSSLVWFVPILIFLLIIPVLLTYLSQKEYEELRPEYERAARNVRIRMINEGMIGTAVRVEGVVERTYFRLLNRPQYLVADRTGEISVKMFTSPEEDVKDGDVVEVLGMIIHRYVIAGDPVINCVAIRKIEKKLELKKK